MATRPVFVTNNDGSLQREDVSFLYKGITPEQKTESVSNLHRAFQEKHPTANVLEISTKSDNPLGRKLSAFNLTITLKDGRKVPLECAFQAGKVFSKSGAQKSVLNMKPWDAKTFVRQFSKEGITAFEFDGEKFPTEPKTLFYNWLYAKALSQHPELAKELLSYNAFTDIEFNPEKSINCQAEAAAVYVSLAKRGKLKEALSNPDIFKKLVYDETLKQTTISHDNKQENLCVVSISQLLSNPALIKEKNIDWVITSDGSHFPGAKTADFSKHFSKDKINAMLNPSENNTNAREAFQQGLNRLDTALSKNLKVAIVIDDAFKDAFEKLWQKHTEEKKLENEAVKIEPPLILELHEKGEKQIEKEERKMASKPVQFTQPSKRKSNSELSR